MLNGSGQGTSSAPHLALGIEFVWSVCSQRCGRKSPASALMPTWSPPHWKSDLHNLLSAVGLSHIWQYAHCSHMQWKRERENARGIAQKHAAWLKLVCGVNDNRERCHIERLLGLLRRVCPSPPCLQGALITLPIIISTQKALLKFL